MFLVFVLVLVVVVVVVVLVVVLVLVLVVLLFAWLIHAAHIFFFFFPNSFKSSTGKLF